MLLPRQRVVVSVSTRLEEQSTMTQQTFRRRPLPLLLAAVLAAAPCGLLGAGVRAADDGDNDTPRPFRAGAATACITPPLGEPIVGGFHPFPAEHIHDDVYARCLVLDDGNTQLAVVICDLLGLHRSVSDEARRLIAMETGIPREQVLIAATHTHSATTALGQTADDRFAPTLDELSNYQAFVARRIADGVRCAVNLLRPAELAVGEVQVPEHVFNRRWLMRPGSMPENPFGSAADLVKMNPPRGSPNLDRPAGPIDPTLSFLAVRGVEGDPLAVLATYSLHYVGGVPRGHVSADYFGIVCKALAGKMSPPSGAVIPADPPFVAMLANGTSGDINNINFREPSPRREPYQQMRMVAEDVATRIAAATSQLTYSRDIPLQARYQELSVAARHPTESEAAWARAALPAADTPMTAKTISEIYAERVQALARQPESFDVPLQVFGIGPVRIGTMPCEVFAEIGLAFRNRGAGEPSFLISLAHGYLGYLPTPRQHDLGGYETWPGTNRLERHASERMLEALVEMSESMQQPTASDRPSP